MQLHIANSSTVKVPTETADVQSLLHARVNGNGIGNGAHANGHRAGKRRHGPQMRNERRLAALRAETAVFLAKTCNISLVEACERASSSVHYAVAMKQILASGDAALYEQVIAGTPSVPEAAKRIKGYVKLVAALTVANPANLYKFFQLTAVKTAAAKAGLTVVPVETMEPLAKLRAVVDEIGVDQTLGLLALMDETAKQRLQPTDHVITDSLG